jgi:putative flavoprotein involved in K+ transport
MDVRDRLADAGRMGSVDVLIVGAGHAGLGMSALLTQAGREHLVVERRDRLGGGWPDRWVAFTLVTPNWTAAFPGWDYDGADPDGFMGRDEIATRVARYADVVRAPVATSTEVRRLVPRAGGGFVAHTPRGRVEARRVVVATGSYHVPRIPSLARAITPRVTQLHAHGYRNASALPAGAVLVVGSGQTGVQLAEELHGAGRRVYLSVGSAGRVPRRYRGRGLFWWLLAIARDGARHGVLLPSAEQVPVERRFNPMPALSGRDGGHDTNLRRFAADGVELTGRLRAAAGERLTFAADLTRNLAHADRFFDQRFRPAIDAYIAAAGIDAPPAALDRFAFAPPERTALDLARAGISTVIWATGYDLDYRWIDAPVVDEHGYPRNTLGVSAIPGLFFLGLMWQRGQPSASLVGPQLDGPSLVDAMATG